MEPHGLEGVRVLVTGATGFIGQRLVERLVVQERADVRILARTVARAKPLDETLADEACRTRHEDAGALQPVRLH